MNKILSASELDVPPLLLLTLAVISLVFNLCFPQYAYANSPVNQKFARENELKENTIALNKLKKEIEERKTTSTQNVEVYSEFTLEKKVAVKKKIQVAVKAPQSTAISSISSDNGISSRWVTVTAYSSTVDQCDASPFITASGTHVRDGVIATNLLAFGTKVKFPSMYGDKIFTVEDRMNKRFSNRADIWFSTREQAKQFGVRKLEMIVVS
ncbi:MAG: hypothetical protein PHX30_02720 [Candidatus Pacebacteria bacterium]|nr:hypothetical protein [Candidatus Paceibacterota bacterium]